MRPFSTRFSKPMDCGDHTWVYVAEMAPDDRKIKCVMRLGALDVPRRLAHKAEDKIELQHI